MFHFGTWTKNLVLPWFENLLLYLFGNCFYFVTCTRADKSTVTLHFHILRTPDYHAITSRARSEAKSNSNLFTFAP